MSAYRIFEALNIKNNRFKNHSIGDFASRSAYSSCPSSLFQRQT
jgi:hypothetical protein